MKTINRSPVAVRSAAPSLAAAAAGVALALVAAATPARAQYRVGADGHANDANNRLGSGGYNSGGDASYRSANSNLNGQIVTGNVSGLAGFHDRTQEFDPNVGQFNTNDHAVQRFNEISAPVDYSQRSTGTPNYTQFYSQQSYASTPPPDFTPTSNNVGYTQQAPSSDSSLTASPDTRLQIQGNTPLKLGRATTCPRPARRTSRGRSTRWGTSRCTRCRRCTASARSSPATRRRATCS